MKNQSTITTTLTEIAVIIDRSGSMSSIQDDMQGGLWSLICEQHAEPGRCRISVYEFDDEWETRFEGRDAGDIQLEDCRLVPRGSTALNDAVVKSLGAIEARILGEPEDERPELVAVVVITDGRENASTENTAAQAREAIDRAATKFGWNFQFLAADAEGFSDGRRLVQGVANTAVSKWDRENARDATSHYSTSITSIRRDRTQARGGDSS